MAGRSRDTVVFTAPQGGPVTDGHFRNRVWYPAVAAAGIRRFPPRIMRHTAASWLVQDGVPRNALVVSARGETTTGTTPGQDRRVEVVLGGAPPEGAPQPVSMR